MASGDVSQRVEMRHARCWLLLQQKKNRTRRERKDKEILIGLPLEGAG